VPKFKVGDRVERIGALAPDYMRDGIVTAVLSVLGENEFTTQYEVEFGFIKTTLYENQLRLIQPALPEVIHILPNRLLDLADLDTPVGQPEWNHMKECDECMERYIRFVRHKRSTGQSD